MEPRFSPEKSIDRNVQLSQSLWQQLDLMSQAASRQLQNFGQTNAAKWRELLDRSAAVFDAYQAQARERGAVELITEYLKDAQERAILATDVLRERGNNDFEHVAAGTPPVLIYDYEVVLDGRDMKRANNYLLLRIKPPSGVEIDENKRPFLIIDPRAGHGAGIGGFKEDSQVGVALKARHAVYFVAFRPHPEPNQTLADVTAAEAEFVREVARRHPKAPKPVVVGNCQGGWGALLLAATNPDITGPLVINGSPLAYWSGPLGSDPMRYNGGLLGGLTPALLLADLGAGQLDGAHLVSNFEMLNPARNFWGKYFDLYADPEKGRERFLEFERWWGGYHFLAEGEIRWIVEQLFVGNKLARGEARLEHGRHVDLKQIRSPIIIFSSFGDNITPPQQALNWIVDTYADENEIRIRGQRIVYMLQDKVGHLGIFVSASVAKKEHAEMTSTLQTIEALAPGLYEMKIEEQTGEGDDAKFVVSFHDRKMADIVGISEGGRREEAAFAAVDRLSHLGAEVYDLWMRPLVQTAVNQNVADAIRQMHPGRVTRFAFSDKNPVMGAVAAAAENVIKDRHALSKKHPLRQAEQLWSDSIEASMDVWRSFRDAMCENMFLSIYASPAMLEIGQRHAFQRTRKDVNELRMLPDVQAHLLNIERGGYAEAVIRMLVVLADARGNVRRSRLERSSHMLTNKEPFAALGSERRAALIHEQSIIVEFEKEKAVEALPKLLLTAEERQRAVAAVEHIAGPLDEMEPHTIHAIQTFRRLLDLPPIEGTTPMGSPVNEATVPTAAE